MHWKDWCWSSKSLATWCKESIHWKRPWCWQTLEEEGEGGDKGWDGWMASLIQWTWTSADSGRWWGTGRPGVLQSMGLHRVGQDLATKQYSCHCLPDQDIKHFHYPSRFLYLHTVKTHMPPPKASNILISVNANWLFLLELSCTICTLCSFSPT